jgi:beta-lactamase class A
MTRANIGGRLAMPGAVSALAVLAFAAAPRANPAAPMAIVSQQTPALSPPAAELQTKLAHRLQEIAGRLNGVAGYVILDLTSGDRIAHLDHAVLPTASSIKLAIVYELFKQAQEGTIHLDERITLDRAKAVGGSGVLFEMGTPTLSISDYAVLMVTLSDNTATNVLIDRLGMAGITRRMQTLGLGETRLRRHMMDTAAARRGDENVSTPGELVELLRLMNGPQATTGAAARPNPMAEAIELLKKPKESRLRRGLPEGVAVADKPGELDGVRVDAGIVYVTNRPYIFCVMTTFLKDEGEGEKAIEEMSRATYEYFSRLGAGGALGRRLDP